MKKRRGAEQIIGLLRQADVALGKGEKVSEVCKQLGISQQTYYRWRTKYGGMDPKMVRQLQELQKENARLNDLLVDRTEDGRQLKLLVVLIAGSTTLDESALLSILSEWTSDRSYADAIANIEGVGSGPRNNGNSFLQAGVTVFDDGTPDELFSDTNGDLNWLVFAVANDTPHPAKPGETVTDL